MTGSGDTSDGGFVRSESSASTGFLRLLQMRDPGAWRQLASLYTPLIYHWCMRSRLKPQDAADIVQDVFRTVALRIADFTRDRPDGTFRGWLWQITRNKLGDHFRRVKTQPQADGGSDAARRLNEVPESASLPTPDGSDGLGDLCRRALALVRAEFNQSSWDAFWQVVVEERSPIEVAEQLGMSVNSVYLAKSRILHRLRVMLGDQDD